MPLTVLLNVLIAPVQLFSQQMSVCVQLVTIMVTKLKYNIRRNYLHSLSKQQAQLSQTGHATLRVIENFAVTQRHLNLHHWVGRVQDHCNYVPILYCFWDNQHQIMVCPRNWVRGHSRSLKISPLDRSYRSSYQPTIVSIALSCTIFELFDAEECCDLDICHSDHWI